MAINSSNSDSRNSIAQSPRSRHAIRSMFGSIAERYDFTNAVLSGGAHHLWRGALFSEMDKSLSQGPHKVALDLCTGTGDLLPGLQRRFKTVLGIDFCWPMVRIGKRKRPTGAPFILGDALQLPLSSQSVDVVSIAYGVRNFEHTHLGLQEVKRVLRPGGALFVLDFGTPQILPVKLLFSLYSRYVIPALGGLLTGNRQAYRYLPESSRSFVCGRELCLLLERLGYSHTHYRALWGGIAYLYWARA